MSEPRPRSALERLQELDRGDAAPAPARADEPARPEPRQPAARRGVGGALAVVALLLWKFKFVAVFLLSKLKLLLVGAKLLKFGKLFTTGWTMLLSMWAYSMFFGAPFAIGFVLLILVHELGHGLAARLTGLPVSAPVFIPFFGAAIMLKRAPRDTYQDFIIGYGGPLAGTLGGLACLGASFAVGEHWGQLLFVLAYFTFVINLFNLMPVWQLDGARITAPLRPSLWALTVGLLTAVLFYASGDTGTMNPMALMVVLVGAIRLIGSWHKSRRERHDDSALGRLAAAGERHREARDHAVTERHRWIACASYVLLASALIVLIHQLHVRLPQVG